jgi:hypothetical protein
VDTGNEMDGTPCSGGACCGGTCASCSLPEHSSPTCTGTTCAFVCDAKYTACTAGGVATCLDLKTDAANCGACGHQCDKGVSCSAGFCEPVIVLMGSPIGSVISLTTDGADVYWVNQVTAVPDNAVYQVSISGGTPIQISPISPTGPAVNVGISGSTIAYTIDWGSEQVQLFTATKGSANSGAELFEFAYAYPPLAMTNQGTTFYEASGEGTGYVISQASLGSDIGGLAVFTSPTPATPGSTMAAASNAVFWTDVTAGTVDFYNSASENSGTVSTGQTGPQSLTTDGTYLYWMSGPAATATLQRAGAHPASQTVTKVASVEGHAWSNVQTVASDGSNVYWADTVAGSTGIYTKPVSGGSPVLRAASLGGFPSYLAASGGYLVWFEPDTSGTTGTLRAVLLP